MKTVYWDDCIGHPDSRAREIASSLLTKSEIFTGNELVVYHVKDLVSSGQLSDVRILYKDKYIMINEYGMIPNCPQGFLSSVSDSAFSTLKNARDRRRDKKLNCA